MAKLNMNMAESGFVRLNPGRHIVRIINVVEEQKAYMMKNPENGSSGAAITWVYKTINETDRSQDDKQLYQSTPADGKHVVITSKILENLGFDPFKFDFANKNDIASLIGKKVEVEVAYGRDANGQERSFANVKKVFPYVETGAAGSANSFENYKATQPAYNIASEDVPF